jgi:phytoene synthase
MTVAESYRFCEHVARARARNFYYSFILLSPQQRRAMCAIYAFMRYCDDLSDDSGIADRAGAIRKWRADLDRALARDLPENPVWPAFHDAVRRYSIPSGYFYDMIEGVSSDLEPRRIQTFDELYRYCYLVASVVGLTIIHIFGFEDPRALELAEKCGIAFQLTNILRDVREDALRDRVYLPAEDLARFQVNADDLKNPVPPNGFVSLMSFEAARARDYYQQSQPLVEMVHAGSRPSLRALIEIYRKLLDRIEESGYDVLSRRVRIPAWQKALIVIKSRLTAPGQGFLTNPSILP